MSEPTIADQGMPESERLDLERRRLECEKRRVEIAQAAAPWWTHPGYIGSLVPIVLAIVGFGTAFATGFFDTERATLKSEIETLAVKRDQLLAANEGIQKKIDDAYLKLYAASAEAQYALSHITSDPSGHDKIKAEVEDTLPKLSPADADVVRSLLSFSDFTWDMAKITAEELDLVGGSLKDIPASPWAKELRPMPKGYYIPDRVVMEAPDGRLYDPTDGRYYRPDELGK